MQTTTNYGLKKIDLADSPPDITVINPNWDTIDQLIQARIDKALIANNLVTTAEGLVLDARQGKVLQDQITAQNNNLADLFDAGIYNEFTQYPSAFLGNKIFDIRCVMGIGAPTTYFPTSNALWYNVITIGISSRCTQIATCGYQGFSESQKIYMRNQHDSYVSAWREI